ncbi:MAG: 1-acyl-sn-glycerol-3-phosphate acyltransferase [Bacteroidales bacterium]|nr:MAG: 1-acyl-sn-glycerol-3-phosphate acyltransferase [Bacteroidales bacterium]
MKSIIVSLYVWIFAVITIIIIFPVYLTIWLLTVFFDKKLIIVHFITSLWAALYTWINPWWKITIENREKIKKGKTYIIISNHQSMLDILVLFRLFVHFRWVSKTEIFKTPVVGWIMTLNNYIRVKRGDKKSIIKMIETSRKVIASGISILIFPEGTRSEDGNLRQFKDGAFNLAVDTKTDILPVLINAVSGALAKKGIFKMNKLSIKVRILDEIPYSDFEKSGVSEIRNRIHGLMSKQLQKLKNSLKKDS